MKEIYISPEEIKKQKETAERIRDHFLAENIYPRVYIQTYGCQQNEADSERILGACVMCGYTITETIGEADLIIINTCAIREHAELKVFSSTGPVTKLKEKNSSLVTMLCGCMAQEEHVRERLYKSYPYIDVVFGTDMHHRVPEIIYGALKRKKRLVYVNELPHKDFGVISEDMPQTRLSGYRAWVSVMYGCNNFCSYCIVPYVRGRERSRRSSDVLTEVESLLEKGYKDITLLGQNVNSYSGELSFPGLLKTVSSLDHKFWLRFMTSHPKDASKELIDTMAENKNIAGHFHLPIQSGSNRILKQMNRGYTREKYLEIAGYIRNRLPGAAITSDIICGFPGETEEDFLETMELVESVRFDMLYTFIYSPRKGTKAAEMDDQLPHNKKTLRFDRLMQVQNKIALEINEGYIGQTVEVLSDGINGRTSQNKIVSFDRPAPEGKFVNVEITSAHPYALDGKLKNK